MLQRRRGSTASITASSARIMKRAPRSGRRRCNGTRGWRSPQRPTALPFRAWAGSSIRRARAARISARICGWASRAASIRKRWSAPGADEKRLFFPGAFPNVSRTGNWVDVAHYTQMIWKGTTHVGCAIYRDGAWDYLICRYSPPGNRDGKVVP